jgi:threonine synthase
MDWTLVCSECAVTRDASGLPTVCPSCGAPWLVRYPGTPDAQAKQMMAERPWSMWRYREWLPLEPEGEPVTLGEGATPLVRAHRLERHLGVRELWIKDESKNPTGSFKARGLAMAVTRARAGGARGFTIPTAGNAGVALSAYGARAGLPVRVFAPRTTPQTILQQIRAFGAHLELLDGHIGDCGRASRAYADASGAFDVSTLREPYRIEGKKTLGLELAEQFGWRLPDVVVYPAGGGTGLIGMWKAFDELRAAGWVPPHVTRLYCVQAEGCAPVIKAFDAGADRVEAWPNPRTVAAGLRVPNPLGGRLMLRALRETGGAAVAVSEEALGEAQEEMARAEAVDACPEGGAALAGLRELERSGRIRPTDSVVLFNTGAGWLYR